MAFKLKSGMNPSFKMMGASPVKQENKGDEFGSIEKGQYPNLVEDISEVQKDDIGHFVTGLDDGTGPHYSSDTTRFPANFTTWQGPIKEGDLLDETAHEAWMGVDVETENPDGSNPATGQRMMWDEKSGTYKPFKQQHMSPTTVNIPEVKVYGGPDSDSDDPKEIQREKERIESLTGKNIPILDGVLQSQKAIKNAKSLAKGALKGAGGALPQKTKTEYSGSDGKRGKYKKGFYEKETKRGTKGTAVTIHEDSDEARLERYGYGRKRKKDKVISKKRAERIMRRKGRSHKQAD